MRTILISFVIGIIITSYFSTSGYSAPQPVKAEIEIQPENNNHYSITGKCTSYSQENLVYQLEIHKQGKSGSAKTRQGGEFVTSDGKTIQLSTTTISLLQGEGARISLTIFREGEQIFQKVSEIGSL